MFQLLIAFLICSASLLSQEPNPIPETLYDAQVMTMQGQTVSMSAYRGRVLLIVNTASHDPNRDQIGELQELYEKYQEQGLIILAFPCNDFMNGEPLSSQEIRRLYTEQYRASYPIFDKIQMMGLQRAPLYQYLTSNRHNPQYGWAVDWNFTKFLIDRYGKVAGRFSTKTSPLDPTLQQAIEKALAG